MLCLADIAIFGTTTVWDYLIEIKDSLPGGDKLINKIKTLQTTDSGRARAFIRYVLPLFTSSSLSISQFSYSRLIHHRHCTVNVRLAISDRFCPYLYRVVHVKNWIERTIARFILGGPRMEQRTHGKVLRKRGVFV